MSGYGAPIDAGTQYLCGNCGSETRLKSGEPIQCRECGYRCACLGAAVQRPAGLQGLGNDVATC